ncbi:C2H2 transcription factor (Con7), putative [Trichophyton verrucosum HKI 0517]|uniref:C2H2 transcription factor (Con7), putative n=1 Tax=Trichophyton verrucosum (strain HKI 0517) TaxID=663202 RepID=D4D592_TRIVH|nr:C2H2 transcription factor (Con7), putative [Trichophyton verrucosum HKI 0517]EFE42897.1 C2H2 transcription factor (Con7), putative [Trichophyton verrucosum HKI 0517]
MDRPASDYAQAGLSPQYPSLPEAQSEQSTADQATASAAVASPTQTEARRTPQSQYSAPPEPRSGGISASNTPQPDYNLHQNSSHPPPPPAAARPSPYPEYLTRQPQYHHAPHTQAGGPPGMAQATSPSMNPQDGQQSDHRSPAQVKSDTEVPIDPSIAASSPSYPPPYSPYAPQSHDMAQYQSHPPQMYARPDWPHQYGAHQPGMPGPYSSPASVSSASPAATAGPRPGQVFSFVPIPGSQQHKRPRRRYEEIERMYKCGWNGCEKAYGTLNHLNAHVTMQSHGAKRSPDGLYSLFILLSLCLIEATLYFPCRLPAIYPLASLSLCNRSLGRCSKPASWWKFKEIRKEWKARKKEEDNQRKAAEERERAAAQANQVDSNGAPSGSGQPSQPTTSYAAGVRPQLPPIGYQPADGQVPGQYGAPPGGLVYPPGNGQMPATYSPSYPHSPYGQGSQVYPQPPRE